MNGVARMRSVRAGTKGEACSREERLKTTGIDVEPFIIFRWPTIIMDLHRVLTAIYLDNDRKVPLAESVECVTDISFLPQSFTEIVLT